MGHVHVRPRAHAILRRCVPGAVAGALVLLGACADEPVAARDASPMIALPRELSASERAVIGGSNAFAFGLLRSVTEGAQADDNVFVSPLSVSMALGLTMNGTDGATQEEMRATLGFGSITLEQANAAYGALVQLLREIDPAVEFRIANSIWARQGFPVRPEFLARARESFDAEARAMDFRAPATVDVINAWVSSATDGKILTIVKQIPPDVVMYLINAIYFKGNWREPFDPRLTAPRSFTSATGAVASVPTMRQTANFALHQGEGYRAIDLPYGRGAYSMTVILPDAGRTPAQVLAALDGEAWTRLTAFTDTTEIEVRLPKFKVEREYTLNETLQAMGIRQAFGGEADFSLLSPTNGLYISEVKHKTFVDVDEVGTRAAAVTSVAIAERAAQEPFAVNRPFLFVLRERFSGTILFAGRIAKVGS